MRANFKTETQEAAGGLVDEYSSSRITQTFGADLWLALCRRKFPMLTIFGSILFLTLYFTLKTEPLYLASAELIIEPTQEKVFENVISGLASFTSGINSPKRINNYVEILKSKALAQKVIETYPEIAKAQNATVSTRNSQFKTLEVSHQLRKGLSVKNLPNTDVISIQYQSKDPELAVKLANAFASVFQEYELNLTKANIRQMREFIETQLQTHKEKLDSAEKTLELFKQQRKVFSINEAAQTALDKLSTYESLLEQTRTERKTTQEQLNHLKDLVNQKQQDLIFADSSNSPQPPGLIYGFLNSLQSLQSDRTNLLLQGYAESHPRVLELEQRIQKTKESALNELNHSANPPNNVTGPLIAKDQIQPLLQTIADEEIELHRLRTKEKILTDLVKNYEARLTDLPASERQLAKLIRQVEVSRSLYSTLSQRYEEAKIAEASKIGQVRIIGQADKSQKVKPNLPLNIALGIILAAILAIGSGLGLEYFDTTLKHQNEVEKFLPVLATIPKLTVPKSANGGRANTNFLTADSLANPHEAFFVLRTALLYSKAGQAAGGKTLIVTSPDAGEGKSTIATNLASVLAKANYRTLLIDADLRNPTLHTKFSTKNYPGLTDAIVNGFLDALKQTPIKNLNLLTAGTSPPSPADILNSNSCGKLLKELKQSYDFIVIDTPPVSVCADASILAARGDGVILTVRLNQTTKEALLHSQKVLRYARANIIGAVVNYENTPRRYGSYYYRYKNQKRPQA